MKHEIPIKQWGDILIIRNKIKTEIETMDPLIYQDGYYSRKHSPRILKQKINDLLSYDTNSYKRREILDYVALKRLPTNNKSWEDPNSEYVALKNGHYNLKTMELEEPTPNNFLTYQLPIEYDYETAVKNLPQWQEYVKSLVTTDSDVKKLQEHLGNMFANHYETKKLLLVYGPQDSGKSTFIKIMEYVIGKDNYCSLSLNQIGEKFTDAELFQKKVNFCAEISYGKELKHYAEIKILTGGDAITVQRKYKDPFEFNNKAKLIFAANGIPVINFDFADDAFYRRWDFIEFPNHFKPDNSIYKQYTTPEMKSAIFLWMVQGYVRLRDNSWRITAELTIDEIKEIFANSGDKSIEDLWLTNSYEAGDYSYPKKLLYEGYKKYCKKYEKISLSYMQFCKYVLNQKHVKVIKHSPLIEGKQIPSFRGLRVKKQSITIIES